MRILAMLLAVWALSLPARAQGVEARTEHFRVATAGAAELASETAAGLERFRRQFAALGLEAAPGRTEVVVFGDTAAMRPCAPPESAAPAGFYRQGTDSLFIAVAWKEAGDPLRVMAHELAHQATMPLTAGRPLWLREGLADLLSTAQPEPGGRLRVGAPVAPHLDELRRQPWLAWPEVFAATRGSKLLTDPQTSRRFYAQSWLAAHLSLVGHLKAGIRSAVAAVAANPEMPAKLPESLATELLPVTAAAAAEPAPAVQALPAWEYEHRLAELLRALNRNEAAREALESLRASHPERPEPAESLGALEMDALRYEEAEKWLAEAVRLRSANPVTHYRYGLLLLRPGGDAETAGRHARRAVELDPGRPLHWLAQAQAEMVLGRWEAARASLAQMRARTADPVLLAQAAAEWDEIERRREEQLRPPRLEAESVRLTMTALPPPEAPSAPSPAKPAAPAPPREPANPYAHPGTLTFVGHIRSVQCGEEKILAVSNPRLAIRVRERRGQPARLYYAPQGARQIPCGLKNVPANVVYRPLAAAGPLNGDVVAIVF